MNILTYTYASFFNDDRFFLQIPTWRTFFFLFFAAFVCRGIVFHTYLQHNERYHQADSADYHNCTLGLLLRGGMKRIDTNQPIFWRTPGYPLYLLPFYKSFLPATSHFSDASRAQKAAIWLQIFLSSFAPILIFFLALLISQNISLAWISCLIFIIHPGFVLASGYLLTEALAVLFFLLFLIYFFKIIFNNSKKHPWKDICLQPFLAALALATYTWMRPNGQFVMIASIPLLFFSYDSFKNKLTKILIFCTCFFAMIAPYYIRNHCWTDSWFFCPMSGPYLATFCAPKIMRTIQHKPLNECINFCLRQAQQNLTQKQKINNILHTGKVIPQEFACGDIAWPWIKKHPFIFAWEWTKEVGKTMFDLYGSQLVAFANETHTWDPPEEFLLEKIKLCLYAQPMSSLMHLICWLELLFYIIIWLGIIGSLYLFVIQPLYTYSFKYLGQQKITWIVLALSYMMVINVVMTGGFGYARLRMPIEPLIIILSLLFWLQISKKQGNKI